MDGKGVFVWSAYAITLLALIISVIMAKRRKKIIFQEIEDSLED